MKQSRPIALFLALCLAAFNLAFSQASKLAITSVNGGLPVQAGVPFSVTVVSEDSAGNPSPVTLATGVTLTLKVGTGTLGGSTSGVIGAGSSTDTLSGVTYTKAEAGVVLTASAISGDALAAGDSNPFTVQPGPASSIVMVSGDGQTGAVTSVLNPFVVEVHDVNGNTVPGVPVTFSLDSIPSGATGQSLSSGSTSTDANGRASTILTLGSKPGRYIVNSVSTGLSGSPVKFTATATTGPATAIVAVSGSGQSAPVGTALSPFIVKVTDVAGNPVSGVTVSFTLASAPPGAKGQSLSVGSAQTGVDGQASTTLTLGDKTGTYIVNAASSGLSGSPIAFSATATIGTASTISQVSGDGQNAQINSPLSPFVVKVTDAGGNPVSGITVTFALDSIPGGSTGQSLSTTTAQTGVDGQASTILTLGNKVGRYVVNARSSGLSGSPVKFTATATNGPATTIAMQSGNGQTAPVNSILSPFVVKVTDAGGNPVAGVAVTFSIDSAPANAAGQSLSTGATTTGSDGLASTTLTLGNRVGVYTVGARSAGLGGGPVTFTATASTGTATALSMVSGNGQSGPIGSTLQPFVVRVTDVGGNPVSGATVTFSIDTIPPGATGQSLSAATVQTGSDGQASTALTLGNKVGRYAIGARSAGLVGSPVFFAATATTGPAAAITLVSGNSQSGPMQSTLPSPLTVRVADSGGNPVQGVTVRFSIDSVPANATGQKLSDTSVVTAANGNAFTTLTLGSKTGSYRVGARSNGLAGSPVVFTATATTGSPASIALVSGNNQSGPAGTALQPFTVLVSDAGGNPVSGVSVTFRIDSIPPGSIGASLSATNPVTGTDGLTASILTLGNRAGRYIVSASGTGAGSIPLTGSPVIFTATAVPGTASRLVITGEPQPTQIAGKVFAPALSVAIQDAVGNVVAGDTSTVRAVLVQGTGQLKGTVEVKPVNGIATFTSLTYETAQAIRIGVMANGLQPDTTGVITVQSDVASALSLTTQPPATVNAGVVLAPPIAVQLRDQFGNLVSQAGVAVSVSVQQGPGGLLGTLTQATASTGQAVFADLSFSTVGTRRLRFSSPGLTEAVSDSFNITPGAPDSLVFVVPPSSSVAGAPFVNSPVVEARDRFGNIAIGSTATVTVALSNPGPAVLSGQTSVPLNPATGRATFTGLSVNKAGTYTLTATATGVSKGTVSGSFAITPAAPAVLAFTQQPGTAVAGSRITPPVIVAVQDAFGNVVSSASTLVTLVLTGGGSLPGSGSVTVQSSGGIASFDSLIIVTAGTGKQLVATSPGLTGDTSAVFTVNPAPLSRLLFHVQPGGGTAGIAWPRQPVILLQDQFGNTVTGARQTITIAIHDTATHGASLLGGGTVIEADPATGSATFSGMAIDKAGQGYTLTATGSTVATLRGTVVSDTFSIVAGAARSVRVETAYDGSGSLLGRQSVSSGTSLTVYAVARDEFNNYAGNIAADAQGWGLDIVSGGVEQTDLVPSADRKSAVFTGRVIGKARILVATRGLASVPSDTLSVVQAGQATKVVVETQSNGTGQIVPAQSIRSGRSIQVYAIARDASDNFIGNIAADWSMVKVAGGVADSDLVPAPDRRSAVFTAHRTGKGQIMVISGSLSPVRSDTLTILPGIPARVIALSGMSQSALVGTRFAAALSAQVRDSADNPVPGTLVHFVAPGYGASGSFGGGPDTAVTSNGQGIASAPFFTANTIAGSYADTALVRAAEAALFPLTNDADSLNSFSITSTSGGSFGIQYAQTPFAIRVTARDRYGNIATAFTGSVTISSDGTLAAGGGSSASFSAGVLASHTVTFAAAGKYTLTVQAQRPGGTALGHTDTITVINPTPTVASIAPTNGRAGQTLDIVVIGSGFVSGATVLAVSDSRIATSTAVNSSTQITATLRIDSLVTLGPKDVIVANLPPGGGTVVVPNGFIVGNNPVPVLTSISPSEAQRFQTLSIGFAGANFLSGASTVTFQKPGITVNSVKVDSGSHLTASITITGAAPVGIDSVAVVNAPPGGGTSAYKAFTLKQENVVPPSLALPLNGAPAQPLTLVLQWQAAGSASHYHLQLSTTPDFAALVVNDSTVTGTSRQVGPLSPYSGYYWRVRSQQAAGAYSAYSSVWNFNTIPLRTAISDTTSFPAYDSPASYKPEDYRIVGLPGGNNGPLARFLPGTPGTDWIAYRDNGQPTNYFVQYNVADSLFAFAPGRAFWVLKRGPLVLKDSILSALPDSDGVMRIPLQPGWNLIANPLPTTIGWPDVQRTNNNMVNALFEYSGSGMTSATAFEPYKGYYFENTQQRPFLAIPYAAQGNLKKQNAAAAWGDSGWSVDIALEREKQAVDRSAWFGIAAHAIEGRDDLDLHKPHAIGAMAQVVFDRPGWDSLAPFFASDIRPPVRALARWSFTVQAPNRAGEGQQYTVRFSGVERVPPAFAVYLVDEAHARYQDLRQEPSCSFAPSGLKTPFSVLIGTAEQVKKQLETIVPREFALAQNYPNPFNPTTTIAVDVPATSPVSVIIYNILGEEVRTIHQGELSAGRHLFTWNGNNDRGLVVGTGVYLCRMSVSNGPSFIRKMLFLK